MRPLYRLYILAIVAHRLSGPLPSRDQTCYDADRGFYAVGSAARSARAARTDRAARRHRRARLDAARRSVRDGDRVHPHRGASGPVARSNRHSARKKTASSSAANASAGQSTCRASSIIASSAATAASRARSRCRTPSTSAACRRTSRTASSPSGFQRRQAAARVASTSALNSLSDVIQLRRLISRRKLFVGAVLVIAGSWAASC